MKLFVYILFIAIQLFASGSFAKNIEYSQFKLENGLEVVVVPNASARAVSHMLLVRAGAADDQLGASGVAHYLEHLLFKGTKQVAEGEYSRIIDQLGGEHNAFTSADMTGYYVTISPENLPKIMELEADRMRNYAPSDAAYEKEREVIIEERRMRTDNNPSALINEAMNAAMFRHHPYGTPIIGWAHEMAKLTKQDAEIFFKLHYNPENMVLMLVGDVQPKQGLQLAQKYYGAWTGNKKQLRNWVNEPPRNTSNLVTMRHVNVMQPKLMLEFPAPSFATATNPKQIYGLLLAEELLGNGRTGTLYQELVKKQKLATSVNVSYYPFSLGDTTFSIAAIPAKGVKLAKLRAAILAQLQNFNTAEIEPKSLQRAKNQMKASTIYAQDSLQAMSFFMATLHMIGLPLSWFNDYPQNIEAVDAEQIKNALHQHIKPEIAVTGYLIPNNPAKN